MKHYKFFSSVIVLGLRVPTIAILIEERERLPELCGLLLCQLIGHNDRLKVDFIRAVSSNFDYDAGHREAE